MIGFSDAQHCFLAKSKAYKTVGVRIREVHQCQITARLWCGTVAHHHTITNTTLKFSLRMAEATSSCLCAAAYINEHFLLIFCKNALMIVRDNPHKLIQLWKQDRRIFSCHQLHNTMLSTQVDVQPALGNICMCENIRLRDIPIKEGCVPWQWKMSQS